MPGRHHALMHRVVPRRRGGGIMPWPRDAAEACDATLGFLR